MKKFTVFLILTALISFYMPSGVNAQPLGVDYQQIFDDHGSMMMLIDPQTGSIVYANQAACDFYGYSKDQLQSMEISQINTLSSEETAQEMESAVQEQRNFFVFKHRLAGGEIRTVEVYSYPHVYEDRELLFSVIHDITAKAQLEERNRNITYLLFFLCALIIALLMTFCMILITNYRKLKRKNEEISIYNELRNAFFNADDSLIYLKDENLKYAFVNKAFEEFYQKEQWEIIGRDDFDLSCDEFAQKRRKTDLDVIAKNDIISDEVEWEKRIYKTTKFPIKLFNGKYGVGAYIKDVTEDYQNKIKNEKAVQRNQILVDIMNHDFNSTQEQLDYALNESLRLTDSKFGYIYLYHEESQELIINSWSKDVMAACEIVEKQTRYQLEHTGLWGEVIRQRKPIVVNNFEMPHPLKKGYPQGHVKLKKFMSVPVIIDGRIVAVVGLANKEEDYDENDISQLSLLMNGVWNAKERREIQVKLDLERKKYLLTLLSIGDGVMVVDKAGRIEMLNTVAEKITGWSIKEAKGRHYKEVFVLSHEKEGNTINDPVEGVLKTDKVQLLGNHAMLTSKDGTKFFVEDSAAPIKDEKNNTSGVVLVFRDVTEKKEQRRKIEYLSFHDSLTGLYNRRFFEEELARIDTKRNLPISILMGDVNGLKLTNDIFGHSFGDMLLQKVADVLRKVCRADDIIARWGGDEYVILLPRTKREEAKDIALRIKDQLAKERVKVIKCSISMGYDTKEKENEDILHVVESAENNMYSEKMLVRNSIDMDFINSIIHNLHEASPREESHAKRVSGICQNIGKAMNLPEVEIRKLKEAGFLHDIGKIAVDAGLSNKNDPLTAEEWKEIKKHPVIGYRILNAFDDTLDIAEYVLDHHERWDGSGYPKGLKGEEIPKLARILALAESYDAMINPLTPKKPMTKEEAITEIEKNAGFQFDPEIADLFIKMMHEQGLV